MIDNGDSVDPYKIEPSIKNFQPLNYDLRRLETNNATKYLKKSSEVASLPSITSGTYFSFLVYVLDQNDKIYKTDSSSKALLKEDKLTNLTSNDPKDRVSIFGDEVIAKKGIYNFSESMILAYPGS